MRSCISGLMVSNMSHFCLRFGLHFAPNVQQFAETSSKSVKRFLTICINLQSCTSDLFCTWKYFRRAVNYNPSLCVAYFKLQIKHFITLQTMSWNHNIFYQYLVHHAIQHLREPPQFRHLKKNVLYHNFLWVRVMSVKVYIFWKGNYLYNLFMASDFTLQVAFLRKS